MDVLNNAAIDNDSTANPIFFVLFFNFVSPFFLFHKKPLGCFIFLLSRTFKSQIGLYLTLRPHTFGHFFPVTAERFDGNGKLSFIRSFQRISLHILLCRIPSSLRSRFRSHSSLVHQLQVGIPHSRSRAAHNLS